METNVVGAGIGGLAVAALLARGGRRVTVWESASEVGGRARSQALGPVTVNLGPHALYRGGRAAAVLRRLAVPWSGGAPAVADGWRGGERVALPGSLWGLAGTRWLGWRQRVELGAAFAGLGAAARAEGETVGSWLAGWSPPVQDVLAGLVRLTSYCADPELDLGAAARQLGRWREGVAYVDGGWQSLVEGLAAAARASGVIVRTGEAVEAVEDGGVRAASGHHRGEVVLAVSPETGRRLGVAVPPNVPVRMASLDLWLDDRPPGAPPVVLGLDVPLYLSDHGSFARLGGAVVHAARYLPEGEEGTVGELEALLDGAWPGWRARERRRRFLPALTVAGHAPRPGMPLGPRRIDGVWRVGDAVEAGTLLADAALGSAADVADAILRGDHA